MSEPAYVHDAAQILVDPEPLNWQLVPSDPPIAVQVARFVALPSLQAVTTHRSNEPSQLPDMLTGQWASIPAFIPRV